VSVSSSGTQASGSAPAVSTDGRWVAFVSNSAALAEGGRNQVFLRDRESNSTVLVSASTAGTAGNGASESPAVSADGRFVAFASTSSDLVGSDANGFKDVFVRDMDTGTTSLVSVATDGTQGSDISSLPFRLR
jgi:Tol biopolymer transport system component